MNKLVYKNIHFKTTGVDEKLHTISGVFSTADTDRHDEVVKQDGWKLDEFLKNPVVLFAHDHYQPAVGQVIELKKDEQGNLAGTIKFAYEEYDFAATIFNLYAGGYMRAFSVGFMNDIYEYDQTNDQVTLVENTLYEISCVNVPANAMALAYSKGIDMGPIERYMKKGAEKTEISEKKAEDTIEKISASNNDTIRTAIGTLQKVLEAREADIKASEKVEHATQVVGKSNSVKLINKAIRDLLKVKSVL